MQALGHAWWKLITEELLYRLKCTQRLFTVRPTTMISINFIGLPCRHMRGTYAYLFQFLKILWVANGKFRYLFTAILILLHSIWCSHWKLLLTFFSVKSREISWNLKNSFYSIIIHNRVILSSKQILDGRTSDRPTHRAKL